MECWVTDYQGKKWDLPPRTAWRFTYTAGSPCDSFQVECLWGEEREDGLADLVYFGASEKGERVFTGLVDECECTWDENGSRLTISGRGMAARLLDNEAKGADYQVATLADLLRDAVTPYGMSVVEGEDLPHVAGFSVETGSSEWTVVENFVRYYGGREPRFDRQGRLILTGWQSGVQKKLGSDCPVTSAVLRDKRYGVLSQVLVRNPNDQGEQTVSNTEFRNRGGMRRQVLTMPRKSGYEAMRYRADYQLQRSAEEQRRLILRSPRAFLAFPGDVVELELVRPGLNGRWRVWESTCGSDEKGTYTELELSPVD